MTEQEREYFPVGGDSDGGGGSGLSRNEIAVILRGMRVA
ncbi:MAG: hypothetical protein ACJAQT_003152 [Akkermansiaceae bacterium]|jgi:hypothetical protein